MMDLNEQVVWITGASGALGRAICEHLVEQGARVIVSGRHPDTLPVERCGVERRVLDVTDRQAVDAAAQEILFRHGQIDGLVTCTTLPRFGDFLLLQDHEWRDVLDTKLMGSIRPARAVLPSMITRGSGSLVFISGRGGTVPPTRHLPGACANSALNLLAQGLATEYGQYGIRVNSVAPGPIESPRLDQMKAGVANARSALGGPGTPADVAHAVSFLLAPQSRHVTGINLPVDGGRAK
jgi:NAD(P)-dependent dehydrogenase (short-subunit alcohol dehydrogenase family)